MPLPALDGSTPRAAAASGDASLKARLVEMVDEIEVPRSTGINLPGVVIVNPRERVRAELGLG